jgi:hypothetical protein
MPDEQPGPSYFILKLIDRFFASVSCRRRHPVVLRAFGKPKHKLDIVVVHPLASRVTIKFRMTSQWFKKAVVYCIGAGHDWVRLRRNREK